MSDFGPSKLVRRIARACRVPEPDMALNFEIADLINEKQGSAPREAALTVVKFVNDRDPFVGINALTLLDCLVKNCGYPFHLQISRKEFLNELVKRFPEKPPYKYNKVQRLVLTQIEEWNETICKSSRYKKDLGFIRDMHRLLSYKGYIFPEINKSDLAVLNPSENLKSIEEIQEEERVAQSAKLQELIRRGRPEDLAEANKLMKIMSGFQEDKKTAEITKQKIAEDISKIKGKVEVFSDMVNNYNENDSNAKGNNEILEEFYTSLKVSQPTLKKIIAEEQDDQEAVSDLLKLNDTINLLLQKYSLLKNKDLEGASKINVTAQGDANLIDFDDDFAPKETETTTTAASGQPKESLLDLLGDLNLSSSPSPTPAPISLSLSSPSNTFGGNTNAFESLTQLQNLDSLSQSPLNQGSITQQNEAFKTNDLLFSNKSINSTPKISNNKPETTVNTSSYLKFTYSVLFKTNPNEVSLQFFLSNLSLGNLSNVTILLAVPKGLKLDLKPASSNFLLSMSTNGINQIANISSYNAPITGGIKIKWKIDYMVNGTNQEETGILVVENY